MDLRCFHCSLFKPSWSFMIPFELAKDTCWRGRSLWTCRFLSWYIRRLLLSVTFAELSHRDFLLLFAFLLSMWAYMINLPKFACLCLFSTPEIQAWPQPCSHSFSVLRPLWSIVLCVPCKSSTFSIFFNTTCFFILHYCKAHLHVNRDATESLHR